MEDVETSDQDQTNRELTYTSLKDVLSSLQFKASIFTADQIVFRDPLLQRAARAYLTTTPLLIDAPPRNLFQRILDGITSFFKFFSGECVWIFS